MARPSPLEAINLLEIAPVRLAAWDETDGRIVLDRPRAFRPGVKGLLDRLTYYLSMRRIRLDAIGAFAWQRLDGKTSVAAVARAMREELGDSAEPVEERLGTFVRLLHREGLVAYPGYDHDRA